LRWRNLSESQIISKKDDLPFEFSKIDFSNAGSADLERISEKLSLSLNLRDMESCKEYFESYDRKATDVEMQTIAQTWSEHCYHRTFKGGILYDGEEVRLIEDYIKKATDEISPSWTVSVFKDNAGIVEFDENRSIAAKVETHNHPSAIDPFGGASTGIGGVIRDILGVWAKPIGNTDVLCFGPLDMSYDELEPGIKHPGYLYQGVVEGIGHYGNNMGIPTVNGSICFDDSYVGNVVVYCGCIGTMPTDSYVKNPEPGDIGILAGGKTGKDGIHGVTFASEELSEDSEESNRPAVQIPNPIEEEKVKRAVLKIREEGLGKAITDLGGGGLSSALGEMADDGDCGIHVDLDNVPLKHSNMSPWEIWISESQERMFLVVSEDNLDQVLQIFEDERVEANPVAEFTEDDNLRVDYRGEKVADLDIDFLFNPSKIKREAEWSEPEFEDPDFSEPENLKDALKDVLSSPNVSSKESVIRTYDHEVQGNTVLKPLQGKQSGPNDASVLKPYSDSDKGVVISSGIKPRYGKIDPYWMTASTIDEAIRNNVAAGGRRISLLDNFTWGNPEKPKELGKLVESCEACYDFATSFETPFISGKDSLYNESPMGSVTPTLLITAVGLIPDVEDTVSMELKNKGNLIYLLGTTDEELGGSEYYQTLDYLGNSVPKVDEQKSNEIFDVVTESIDRSVVESCHDLSDGGLGVSAAEMAFSGDLGLELDLGEVIGGADRNDHLLFSESNGRFLVEVTPENKEKFESFAESIPCSKVGEVLKNNRFSVKGLNGEEIIDARLEDLRKTWKEGLDAG